MSGREFDVLLAILCLRRLRNRGESARKTVLLMLLNSLRNSSSSSSSSSLDSDSDSSTSIVSSGASVSVNSVSSLSSLAIGSASPVSSTVSISSAASSSSSSSSSSSGSALSESSAGSSSVMLRSPTVNRHMDAAISAVVAAAAGSRPRRRSSLIGPVVVPRIAASPRVQVAVRGRRSSRGNVSIGRGSRAQLGFGTGSPHAQAPAPRFLPNVMDESRHDSNFECVVCFENLDTGAPIVGEEERNPEDLANVSRGAAGDDAAPVQNNNRIRVRPTASKRGQVNISTLDPKDIVATPCGHIYHRYCLEKWFLEQRKKTCPNCRKVVVSSKLIRLFPNVSEEAFNRTRAVYDAAVQNRVATAQNSPVAASAAIGRQPMAGPAPLPPVVVALPSATATATLRAGNVNAAANIPPGTVHLQRRTLPNANCDKVECADLHLIHGTLVTDFNDLREKYATSEDHLMLLNVQMQSLQESHDRISHELAQIQASAGSSTAKRRRPN